MCHRNKTVSIQSRKHTTHPISLPIATSPVISKLFEYCILHKFHDVFTFSEMQFGFRKGSGCSHAIFLLREVIDYFASHGSTEYMAALDARKAFDRVNHVKLFNLLLDNNVFSSLISVHSFVCLSVCLLYFTLAALVANKRIHNNHIRDGTIYIF